MQLIDFVLSYTNRTKETLSVLATPGSFMEIPGSQVINTAGLVTPLTPDRSSYIFQMFFFCFFFAFHA